MIILRTPWTLRNAGFIEGGTVNSAAALRAFLVHADTVGREVRIPRGTWVFDGPRMSMSEFDNIHITGEGPESILKLAPTYVEGSDCYGWLRFHLCDRPVLENFSIDLSRSTRERTEWAVQFDGVNGATVSGVLFSDASAAVRIGDGDGAVGSLDTTIESSEMADVALGLWMDTNATNSKRVAYTGNRHTATSQVLYSAGCEFNLCGEVWATVVGNDFGSPNKYAVAVADASHVAITGNTADVSEHDLATSAIHIEDGSHDIAVTGNTLRQEADGCVEVLDSYNVTVAGNNLDGAGSSGYAVFVRSTTGGPAVSGVAVSGNTLSGCDNGLYLQEDATTTIQGLAVTGNVFQSLTVAALNSGLGTPAGLFAYNALVDCEAETAGNVTGLTVTGNVSA